MKKFKFFDHARTIALSSEHFHRHGAVLVRGGKIIKSSCNKSRPVSFASKYHPNGYGSLHAEIGCVLNCFKESTRGCDIYVVRLSRKNESFTMSKPCEMCQTICKEMGIKRIYYSTYDGFESIKL